MKTLFITTPGEDYLQDMMLYGLRAILGDNLVDYPKKEVMYKSCPVPHTELYGRGFTIWKLLEDVDVDRTDIDRKIRERFFDLIVFGSLHRQKQYVLDLVKRRLFPARNRFAFLEGEDNDEVGRMAWLVVPFGPYYKRERRWYNSFLTRPINFSIPAQKIRSQPIPKEFLFAKHVQCDEVYKIELVRQFCQKKYVFSEEFEYYENLARSRYAVTMRKSGWDCMRHYEIAANAAVMAFYKLRDKPYGSAPHGLVDMHNVVSFDSADELVEKIDYIDQHGLYETLQMNTLAWVQKTTCERMAENLLAELFPGHQFTSHGKV